MTPWLDSDTKISITTLEACPPGTLVRLYHAAVDEGTWNQPKPPTITLRTQIWKRGPQLMVRQDGHIAERSTIAQLLGWRKWSVSEVDALRRLYTEVLNERRLAEKQILTCQYILPKLEDGVASAPDQSQTMQVVNE